MNRTGIEYLTHTWAPVTGCSRISAGCKNCWAFRMSKRLAGRAGYDRKNPFKVTFHPDRLEQPLRVKRAARIGVCFMGDLFHEEVKIEWIDAVFGVMDDCRQHTFFILTKRPENIDEKLDDYLSNVFIGVSVENQATANVRIPAILKSGWMGKAWVSAEPLLGAIDISKYKVGINQVVVGAETGPGARPMDLAWARAVRDQCRDAGIPFFFKSAGRGIETPQDLKIRELP